MMSMDTNWIAAARRELFDSRVRGGAWSYRRASLPCSEPTAMAALALLATQATDTHHDETATACQAAADWLADTQQSDGSVGVSKNIPTPGWMTSHALLLWSALGGWEQPRARALSWLVSQKGTTVSPMDNIDRVAGHDTTLVGWPWVAETHSWLEPTALAVLALTDDTGVATRARVGEATTLIRDRAIKTGGWNYGNKAVFGRSLRPQPAPTGLALLALSGQGKNDLMIQAATRYLLDILPTTRAAAALGWGLLGLRAWGIEPAESAAWLSESHALVTGRPDATVKLSSLLLGSSQASLALFHRGKAPADGGHRDVR